MSRVTRTNSRIIPERKVVYVGLTPSLLAAIQKMAVAEDRSVSYIIRRCVRMNEQVQKAMRESANAETAGANA